MVNGVDGVVDGVDGVDGVVERVEERVEERVGVMERKERRRSIWMCVGFWRFGERSLRRDGGRVMIGSCVMRHSLSGSV